jgi:hypothetical protein
MVLENILVNIIGDTLTKKMSKSDPEFKNYKENYDRVVQYFQDRFKFIADELVYDVFVEMNEKQDDIVNVLSRNMLDFCDLIRFFANCMKNINPMVNIGSSTQEESENA